MEKRIKRKYTIDFFKNLAIVKGGECLSEIYVNCNEKLEFKCKREHIWKTKPYYLVHNNTWCPYCCNPPKKLCYDQDCKICLEKSFMSSDKNICWSDKNIISSRRVFKHSDDKYFFDCNKCNNCFLLSLHIGLKTVHV